MSPLEDPAPTPPSDDEEDADAVSETSTIVYSHEPFETFKSKVVELASDLFPDVASSEVTVTRLEGGAYNRVIGISTCSEQLVLRIPRSEYADLLSQVSILVQLKKATNIAVPEVVNYDLDADNKLGLPYMLMKRIVGEDLSAVHDEMSQAQKLAMARTVAQLIAQIHAATVPRGYGPLCATEAGFLIGRFTDDGEFETPESSFSPPVTLEDFFHMRFTYLLDQARSDDFRSSFYLKLLEASKHIVKMLPSRSTGSPHVLRHTDFAARNILVHRNSSQDEWGVAGILDWDECEVAPPEVAYTCPGWVWSHPDEGEVSGSFDENDWDPDMPVHDDDCQAVKDAFVEEIEHLLPGFMEVVRETRETPLKKLWKLAKSGIHSNESATLADQVIDFAEPRV